jgi:RNase H-fold protein (predicted Holliday junction resolvase)
MLDGSESAQTRKAKNFIAALTRATPIPVATEDERLTTQGFATIPNDYRHGKSLDALAAMEIVQGYLDRMK